MNRLGIFLMIAFFAILFINCSSDETSTTDVGTTGDATFADDDIPTGHAIFGKSCETNDFCNKNKPEGPNICLTTQFLQLNNINGEMPGGYCSRLNCDVNNPDTACGTGAVCLNTKPFDEKCEGIGICMLLCNTDDDCRKAEGYICLERKEIDPKHKICIHESFKDYQIACKQ
ncbi:MAG: hypothetical protein N2746_01110 [Deltaproteobacteria bacterium]|nr:hypothetical protein [Deltaproteobacteria bacterium]